MLKVGDRCKWSPRAIRRSRNEDKILLRKQLLKVVVISEISNKVKVIYKSWKVTDWYSQRDLIKL